MRPALEIPTRQTLVRLPLPTFEKMRDKLYSELEGRVPHGEYARYLGGLIEADCKKVELVDRFDRQADQLQSSLLNGSVHKTQVIARLFRMTLEYLQDSQFSADILLAHELTQLIERLPE